MQRRIYCVALSSVFSLGLAFAAPQDQQAPPPDQQAPQDQGAPPQGRGRGGMQMDPGQQLKMLSSRLKLSDDQIAQIKPILADHAGQIQALRADTSVGPRDKMPKMRAIQMDADAKISAILTPDQRARYEQMKQQRRQVMQQRMNQNGGGAPDSAPPNQ